MSHPIAPPVVPLTHRGVITKSSRATLRVSWTLLRSFWRSRALAALWLVLWPILGLVLHWTGTVDVASPVRVALLGVALYVFFLFIVSVVTPAIGPLLGYTWWELRTPQGHAVLASCRGAGASEVQLQLFAAAPRGRKLHLGEELGEHVLYVLRRQRQLVHAEALRSISKRYAAFGLVKTGQRGPLGITIKLVDSLGLGQPAHQWPPPRPVRCGSGC